MIGLLIVGAVLIMALLKIRVIFPPLVLALLIIYLLNPLVSMLEKRGVSRGLGTTLSYVILFGSLTVIGMLVVPFISTQVQNFSDEVPQFRVEIVEFIEDTTQSIEEQFDTNINTSQVSCLFGADDVANEERPTHERCDEVTENFRDQIVGSADRITEIGSSLLEILLIFILGPLLALYLLIDLPQLQRDVLNLVPEDHREEVADLGSKIGRAVGGFFRGQLFVALLVGVMSSLGFWLIGLDFWLIIGAIAGFTNLIPLVGPFIGGGLGFLVGTVTESTGLGLKAALVALVVQQIDNHIISPNVMKRTVQLHPVTVMLSLLAGGTVGGFWGVLLAVPAVAVVKLVSGHLWATRVLGAPPTPFVPAGPGASPPTVVPTVSLEPDAPPDDA